MECLAIDFMMHHVEAWDVLLHSFFGTRELLLKRSSPLYRGKIDIPTMRNMKSLTYSEGSSGHPGHLLLVSQIDYFIASVSSVVPFCIERVAASLIS